MSTHRPHWADGSAALALGLAATAYAVRSLTGFQRAGIEAGMWDLVAAVVTDPRFMTAIVLTTALVRMCVQRDRVVSALVRIGTNRRLLLIEVSGAARSMLLPLLATMLACLLTASIAGLPLYTLILPGSAAGDLAAVGISPPLGIGLQVLLVGATLLVIQTVLASVRIVSGSVVPVVAVALVIWGWGGVSIYQLQTVIVSNTNNTSIAESLQAGVIAALNSGAYLDVLIAIAGDAVPVVLATLALAFAFSFIGVWLMDLRIVRSRRTSLPNYRLEDPQPMTIARHH